MTSDESKNKLIKLISGQSTWLDIMDLEEKILNEIKQNFDDITSSKIVKEIRRIFSLPYVKEEIKRYAKGFKGEAKESKEAFLILGKYSRKEEITDEEKKLFKEQIIDILKGVGVVLPLQLIPLPFVSTILLIVMEKTLLSMGIKILPSSFYEKDDENEENNLLD
jgi:hypothetical protein